jgi:biopolymer transport protein ExbD
VAKRIGIKIDMTPMVDVAFLLLIFFMTTTTFKPPERVSVILPGSKSEIHVPETNTIILTVNKAGEIYISYEDLSQTQLVPREDIVKAILTWRAKSPAAIVVVKGDREVNYGAVADIMDALAQSKTLRFNLMTDLKEKKTE